MPKMVIEINAESESALEDTLDEVSRLIRAGFTTGHDRNESASYTFDLSEDDSIQEERN